MSENINVPDKEVSIETVDKEKEVVSPQQLEAATNVKKKREFSQKQRASLDKANSVRLEKQAYEKYLYTQFLNSQSKLKDSLDEELTNFKSNSMSSKPPPVQEPVKVEEAVKPPSIKVGRSLSKHRKKVVVQSSSEESSSDEDSTDSDSSSSEEEVVVKRRRKNKDEVIKKKVVAYKDRKYSYMPVAPPPSKVRRNVGSHSGCSFD